MLDQTLAELIIAGTASELDYMSPDDAAEALARYAYLRSCSATELADAADFIATAVQAERNE